MRWSRVVVAIGGALALAANPGPAHAADAAKPPAAVKVAGGKVPRPGALRFYVH